MNRIAAALSVFGGAAFFGMVGGAPYCFVGSGGLDGNAVRAATFTVGKGTHCKRFAANTRSA